MASNQLSTLPPSLSNLSRLEKLNLSHNLISHVPGCLYNMKALVGPPVPSAESLRSCHPLDRGLHLAHRPLLKPVKEVLEGGLYTYTYLRAGYSWGRGFT